MEVQNIDIYDITLAAFLHDIGKFIQRANLNEYYESNLVEFFCNKYYNKYINYHSIYTYKFLEKEKNNIPLNFTNIENLAGKHHNPDNNLQLIIHIADILSSGMDRHKKEKETGNKFYEQPLISIFSKVKLSNNNPEEMYYKLEPFDYENFENIFPIKDIKLSKEKYKQLFLKFSKEFDLLNKYFKDNFENTKNKNFVNKDLYLKSLDSLINKYTWSIPSTTIDDPDISLYDHLYTTAAFASVLYIYHKLDNSLNDKSKINDFKIKKFLLLSGDMSGIQKTIFNLESGALNAKILRGRSFEIQALSELAAMYILDELELPHFCKIMNAGGRFILLLPNYKTIKEKLKYIKVELEKYFLNKFFGELSLVLSDFVILSSEDFLIKEETGPKYFLEMQKSISDAKYKKFYSILNEYNHVLSKEYNKIKSNQEVCPICKKRKAEKNIINYDNKVCNVCYEQITIGQILPKSKYFFIIKSDKIDNIKYSSKYKLIKFIKDYYFIVSKNAEFLNLNVHNILKLICKYSINRYEYTYQTFNTPFYLPYSEIQSEYTITNNNGDNKNNSDINDIKKDIMTFEEIANKSEGIKKIAMLKSDVDNLGAIFNIAFGNKISISRYSSLSRMFNIFFSSYINKTLSSNNFTIKNDYYNENFKYIYTVFSGGDDLCLIGPWNVIIDYSIFIQKKFKEFVGYNKDITISAGISITRDNLPVRFIAEDAENNLKKSKNGKKNSITIFNTKTTWDDFERLITYVVNFIDKNYKFNRSNINKTDKKNLISNSLLYSFLYFSEAYLKNLGKEININNLNKAFIWKSHLYYKLSRVIEDSNLKNELAKIILENIKYIKIPVSYILYKYRNKY